MVCFVRRSTIDYDVRLMKYVEACMASQIDYIAITWDRQKNCDKIYENEVQYKVKAPYKAGMKNFLALVGWIFFMYYQLFKNIRKYKIIHACNLEIYVFVLLFKLFGKKIIFDIYDSVKEGVESKTAKYADLLILPNTQRLEQINVRKEDLNDFLEVENVPQIKSAIQTKKHVEFPEKIHLSYVGVFEANIRGLENLLTMVISDSRFILDIAGMGGGLEEMVVSYSKNCDRIRYHGKVVYSKALEIMNNSDFIVALYYSWHLRHKYASPNKFYESLCLCKPIITSRDTLVGSQVESNNTGYVVNDTMESLLNIFSDVESVLFQNEYYAKAENCSALWTNRYSDYFNKVIVGEYIEKLKNL